MRSPAFMNIQLFAEPGAGAPTPTPAPTPAPAPITPPVATPPVATPPVATPPVVSQASYTELEKNFKALTDSYKASLGEKERKVFEDNEKDKLIAELQREKRVIEYGSKLSSLELDENTLRVVTEDMMKGEVGTLIKAVSAFIEKRLRRLKIKQLTIRRHHRMDKAQSPQPRTMNSKSTETTQNFFIKAHSVLNKI